MRLKNKVAIVTGGGSSIGLAVAQRLATDGATVVIADIAGAEDAAGGLVNAGHAALGVATDVASEHDVQRMMDQTIARFGKVDILVNNAAISKTLRMTPFEQLSVADWRKILDVNTIARFCVAELPARTCGRKSMAASST